MGRKIVLICAFLVAFPVFALSEKRFYPVIRHVGGTDQKTIEDGIRQIGNCVPPLFMMAIARHVRLSILRSGSV